MRKIIIACVLAAAVFAGCSKATSHTESRNPAAEGEPSMTEAKSSMDVEFEDKIKAIDDMGKQVIDDIRTEASKAVSEIKAAIHTTTTATTAPEPKEVALDVESTNDWGSLRFKSVEIDYENKLLTIQVESSDKSKRIEYASIDKNGAELETAYNANTVWISGANHINDLSEITITYTVKNTNSIEIKLNIQI